MATLALRRAHLPFWIGVGAGLVAWLVAWVLLAPAIDWFVEEALGVDTSTAFGSALAFFLFDLPKVMLLLVGVVTLVGFLRSFVSPERVRHALTGRNVVVGATAAALFGVVTPFCSCSAVPLFIGFVEAGVPLGVTSAFLVSAPIVNELALVLLWGLFGPTIAVAYLVAGLTVAIGAGLVVGRLRLERFVEPYVYEVHAGVIVDVRPTLEQRVREAWDSTLRIVRRVAPWVVIGIAAGWVIHGYLPTDVVAQVGGRANPLAVPLVVMLGVPPIEVLGPGCANCQQLERNAREAVGMAGVEAEIVKVVDYLEIAARGVIRTPGLVIDGKVVSTGRIPSPGDIAELLIAATSPAPATS